MRWARFNADGTAAVMLSRRCAGGVAVPNDVDINDLYRDPQSGKIGTREPVLLQSPRTVFCCDGKDAAPLPAVPEGTTILVNGEPATKPVTRTSPDTVMVETGAQGRAERPIVWRFKTREQIREDVRQERSARLAACDWTTMPDAVLSAARRLAYQTYRTLLRDLPAAQPNATVETITWPKEPQ